MPFFIEVTNRDDGKRFLVNVDHIRVVTNSQTLPNDACGYLELTGEGHVIEIRESYDQIKRALANIVDFAKVRAVPEK